MIDEGKRNLLGVLINVIDYEAAVSGIISSAKDRKSLAVSALAVHGVMTGALDANHRCRLNQLDLALPDGQPVRWALNSIQQTRLKDRVYGPSLMLKVCEKAAIENLPIYLFGSTTIVLKNLEQGLQARFPELKIAGSQESTFRRITDQENQDAIQRIQESGARIVFVGLGCPRQEVWVYENRDALSMPMIAVGAAFDIHSGSVRQAPPFLQRNGLEWLFRLFQEPLRLWKRYVLLNPLFITLFLLQKMKIYTIIPLNTIPQIQNLNYG